MSSWDLSGTWCKGINENVQQYYTFVPLFLFSLFYNNSMYSNLTISYKEQ